MYKLILKINIHIHLTEEDSNLEGQEELLKEVGYQDLKYPEIKWELEYPEILKEQEAPAEP